MLLTEKFFQPDSFLQQQPVIRQCISLVVTVNPVMADLRNLRPQLRSVKHWQIAHCRWLPAQLQVCRVRQWIKVYSYIRLTLNYWRDHGNARNRRLNGYMVEKFTMIKILLIVTKTLNLMHTQDKDTHAHTQLFNDHFLKHALYILIVGFWETLHNPEFQV